MVDRSHVARCPLSHRRVTSALTTRGGGAPPHATRGRTFSPCPRLPYTIHSLHTVSGSFTCLHIASGAAEGEGLSFEARHECVHATEDLEESEEIRVTTKPHMPWLYLDVSAQVVERPPSPAIQIREPAFARLPNCEPPVRLPQPSFHLVSALATHAATLLITALNP